MDYTERFELQKQTASQNGCRDVSVAWETVYAGYARVTSLGSREFWEAAAVQREDTLKLFARWHPALAADTRGHRILWRGRALDIVQVENVGMRNEQAVIKAVMADG